MVRLRSSYKIDFSLSPLPSFLFIPYYIRCRSFYRRDAVLQIDTGFGPLGPRPSCHCRTSIVRECAGLDRHPGCRAAAGEE